MKTCAYCDAEATHRGEGEDVCSEHIPPAARGEYRDVFEESLAEDADAVAAELEGERL